MAYVENKYLLSGTLRYWMQCCS